MSDPNKITSGGRPRSRKADRAIYEACITLLSERGFVLTTIDAVATLSGVSRPSIYRRFADKDDLIESCIEQILATDVLTVPETDDPLQDVLALLENTNHMLTRTPMGSIMRSAIPYFHKYQRVASIFERVGNRRRNALRTTLRRAIKAGAIHEPMDINVLIDGLIGAIYMRFFMSKTEPSKSYIRKLLKELTS